MITKEVFNPFPGLRAFEEDEDYLFFGRERQIDDLLKKLRMTRFIAVIGTSGSGKSSLVKCGLLPSLHSGYMAKAGSSWKVAVLRPGDDPLGNLARTLAKPGVIDESVEMEATHAAIIEATLRRSNLGLIEAVRQSSLGTSDNLLIVVDQFEELFRFNKYEKSEHAEKRDSLSFVDLLLKACKQEEIPIYIVLTMRSDFIGDCTVFSGLAEAINQSQYLVPRMSREERKEAITGPIAVGGGSITPRLLTQLINDVGDSPDQLPILQHALLRTWRYWEENRQGEESLDLKHYLAIGTMAQALSQHAEEAFHELKSESSRKICEKIFRAITEKGDDRQGIRRPTKLKEICNITGATLAEATEIIDTFRKEGRSFLMPPADTPLTEDSIIDISHESLMRIWGRLIKWVEEEMHSAEIYKRLAEAAALFQEARSGLWRNPELQFALTWYGENKPNRFWAQRYDPSFERAIGFLKESKRREDFEAHQKEIQEKLKIRRIRLSAIVLGAAAFVSLLLLIVAMASQARVKESEEKARNSEQAARKSEKTTMESLQIAIDTQKKLKASDSVTRESLKTVTKTRDSLREIQIKLRASQDSLTVSLNTESELKKKADSAKDSATDAKSKAELSAQMMNRLRMLSLSSTLAFQSMKEQMNGEHDISKLLALYAYKFNAANGGDDMRPEIYQALAQATNNRREFLHDDAVHAVAVSADGNKILSGSNDKTVRVWDRGNPSQSHRVFDCKHAVRCVTYARDSRLAIAGDVDGGITIWDLAEKNENEGDRFDLFNAGVTAFAVDRSSNLLIAGAADGAVRLMSLDNPASTQRALAPLHGRITDLALSPDGASLAVVYERDTVAVYDLNDIGSKARSIYVEKNSKLISVNFSHDGKYLAVGGRNRQVFILNAKDQYKLLYTLTGHASGVNSVAFSPGDSLLLATASFDKTVRLWRYKKPDHEPVVLADHTGWVWSIAFSPAGDVLFSASEDKTVRSWPASVKLMVSEACNSLKEKKAFTQQEWNVRIGNNVKYDKEPCN